MLQAYQLYSLGFQQEPISGIGKLVKWEKIPDEFKEPLKHRLPGNKVVETVWEVKKMVRISQCEYSVGNVYIIGWDEDDFPRFAKIDKVYLVNGEYYFCSTEFACLEFRRDIYSYVVLSKDMVVFKPSEEVDYHALDLYKKNEEFVLILRYSVLRKVVQQD